MLYGNNDWRDYLAHYGTPGMRWGVRNGPPYPIGSQKSKYKTKIRSKNLDKWGKDRDHNTLYIAGVSGSGKSTLALNLAKKRNAEVIHLDAYLSPMSEESKRELQNKDFNKHLDQTVKGWRNVIKKDKRLDFKVVDEMAKASEEYSAKIYGKKRLIIEGVQLMDETFYPNRDRYKQQPFILTDTSAIASLRRGNMRDDMRGLDALYRIPLYIKTSKIKSKLVKELELKGKQKVNLDRTY